MRVVVIDDKGMIQNISKKLGEYHDKAPVVLKQALNATAKDARSMLAEQAKKIYAIQKSRFNKAMTIQNASVRKMEAQITATGAPLELSDFRVTSKKPATGTQRPKIIKGKVLVSNSMKPLEVGGIKAFVAQFASGHVSIVQRRGAARLPVKKLFSPSIPKMIGNEGKVYGKIRPKISRLLKDNIRKYIAKTIEKGDKAK